MKAYILILIGLVLSNGTQAQPKPAINGLQALEDQVINRKQLDLIYEKTKVFPEQTEVAIAILKNGQTVFYGIKRSNGVINAFDNAQSVFEIASISKVFTSTLLTSLVLDNKIELDHSIQDHYNGPIDLKEKISFKELSNHTSGLSRLPSNLLSSDYNNPYKDYDTKKLEEYLSEHISVKQTPGTQYEYSNLGAGLLGYFLAQHSNATYEELLQKHIFSKYNMTNSSTHREQVKDKLVLALNYKGDQTANWDFNSLAGAGGILSTVEDLSRFAEAQFDKRNEALALTQQSTFSISDNMDIALGWHIIKTKSKDQLLWHNGGSGGYSSSMFLDIDKKHAVIILSNVSAYNEKMGNIDDLSFELLQSLKD